MWAIDEFNKLPRYKIFKTDIKACRKTCKNRDPLRGCGVQGRTVHVMWCTIVDPTAIATGSNNGHLGIKPSPDLDSVVKDTDVKIRNQVSRDQTA